MKVITVISLMVCSCIGFSQEWNRDTANLIGPVKIVYYGLTENVTDITDYWRYFDTKTEFDRKGHWIYYSNFLEGKEFNTKIRVYDTSTGRHIYDYSLYEGDTTDCWQMIHSKNGQIMKEIHLKDSKKDSSYFLYKKKLLLGKYDYQNSFSIQYFYNSKKKLIRKETIRIKQDSGDTTKYFTFYDDNGRKIKDSTFSKGYIASKTWKYDKDSRLSVATSLLYKATKIKIIDYRNSDSPNISYTHLDSSDNRNNRIEYEYNTAGQLISVTTYYLDGSIRSQYHCEYNEKGLVSREIFQGGFEHQQSETKFEYVYDNCGNWILRYNFDVEHSEYFSVEYRKIEYFD